MVVVLDEGTCGNDMGSNDYRHQSDVFVGVCDVVHRFNRMIRQIRFA
jgi:hypothetical protein